ncbi:MAG: hypothetical protein P8Y76_13470 [bacterium]
MASARRTAKSVAEIETFITMLTTACEDESIRQRLERLLSMPDRKRQAVVRAWVNDLLIAQGPGDFTQAIACLLDDRVAEKAYEVIFQCKRGAL